MLWKIGTGHTCVSGDNSLISESWSTCMTGNCLPSKVFVSFDTMLSTIFATFVLSSLNLFRFSWFFFKSSIFLPKLRFHTKNYDNREYYHVLFMLCQNPKRHGIYNLLGTISLSLRSIKRAFRSGCTGASDESLIKYSFLCNNSSELSRTDCINSLKRGKEIP